METNLQIWENFKKVFDIGFDDKHRSVVLLKYGLNGEKPKTLEEVGKILQISRQRVQQILSKCKKKLKHSTKQRFWKPITDEIYSRFRDERDLIIGSDELKKLLPDDVNKESLLQELKALSLVLDLDKRFSPVLGTGKKRVGWIIQEGDGENLNLTIGEIGLPTQAVNGLTIEELDLPIRIANALRRAGYGSVGGLKAAGIKRLMKVKNIGEKSIKTIEEVLNAFSILAPAPTGGIQDKLIKLKELSNNDFFTLHTLPKTAIGVYEDIKQLKKIDIKQLVSNFRLSKKYIFNIISDLKTLGLLRKSDQNNHLIPVGEDYNPIISSRFKNHPAIKELLKLLQEQKEVSIKDFSSIVASYLKDRKINEKTFIIYAKTLSLWLNFFGLSKHYNSSIYSTGTDLSMLPVRNIGIRKSNYPFLMNTYNEVSGLMNFVVKRGPLFKQQVSKLFKKSPKTIERVLTDGNRLEFFEKDQKGVVSLSRLGQEFLGASEPLRQYILRNQLRNYPFIKDFLERLGSTKIEGSNDPAIVMKSLLEERDLSRKEKTITEITHNTLSWCIVAGLLKRRVKIRKISYFELVGNDK